MSATLLAVVDVTKTHRVRSVPRGVRVEVQREEVLGLTGENGTGKRMRVTP